MMVVVMVLVVCIGGSGDGGSDAGDGVCSK